MRFVGRGHHAIRSTHAKTLEIARADDITARATCVIAVAAPAAQPGPMAGPIRVTISAGDESFTLHALANSSWDGSGSAVIRRSPLRLPGTFATHADAASSDLPRQLVAALQDANTVVLVEIEAVETTEATVVLFAADGLRPGDERLAAEIEAASRVEAQDPAAATLIGDRRAGSTGAPRPRHLIVATADLPRHPGPPAATVETVGLAAPLAAAAAASPTGGPIVLAPDGADPRELLRRTPAAHRLVLATTTDRLRELLALAHETRGSSAATLARQWASPIRLADGDEPELPGRDIVHVCLDGIGEHAVGGDRATALDPGVRAAVAGLLADGVPTRTVARALAELSELTRRDAYNTVLGIRQLGIRQLAVTQPPTTRT